MYRSEHVLNMLNRKALKFDEEKEREYESKLHHQNKVVSIWVSSLKGN